MSRASRFDPGLYLVIGPDTTRGRPLHDVVRAAIDGGATAVQLRWKDAPTRTCVDEARALAALLAPHEIPLIVNDRVDVALAAGAHGVHVGQDDMHPRDVRRLMGADAIVGLSVTSVAEARALDASIVNYAGVGPVFPTASKPDAAPALGLDGVAAVCRVLRVPVVAIGGIDGGNAAAVLAAGAHGVAVISAICSAEQPRDATALLASHVRRAKVAREGGSAA